MFMVEICFIKFRLSLVDNPRKSTEFESATINITSKWSFLCFRVREDFTSMDISKLLYADYFMLTGQRLSSESNFFTIAKGIT